MSLRGSQGWGMATVRACRAWVPRMPASTVGCGDPSSPCSFGSGPSAQLSCFSLLHTSLHLHLSHLVIVCFGQVPGLGKAGSGPAVPEVFTHLPNGPASSLPS